MFEKMLEAIKANKKIIIHRHKNPDGDALGSQIGLKNIITENFPDKQVYMVGDMSARFSFMEGSVMDTLPDDFWNDALAIVLDTSASALISDTRYEKAPLTVRVDHHIFCEKICDIEITDTSYESCCGLITEFAIESGLKLNALASKSLYTGMVTDSGRFRYDSTSSNTFRLASKLMEAEFDTGDIYSNLYVDDFEFIKTRARFVLKISIKENSVAYIYTTKQEVEELKLDTFAVSRGMVNTMGDIRDINVWVNFTESEDGVLAELRSNKYNINKIAVKYGGGGHAKASGATLKSKEEAMQMLSDLVDLTKT